MLSKLFQAFLCTKEGIHAGGRGGVGVGELHALEYFTIHFILLKEKKASLLNLDKLHKLYMIYIYIYIYYIYILYIYIYYIHIIYMLYRLLVPKSAQKALYYAPCFAC